MAQLASTPDGALLAQETLHDYQLRPGDLIRLRLQDTAGHYQTIPFHVAGVVTEFATAPRDSFIVANAAYVAKVTGSSAVQTLLVKTSHPATVAKRLRSALPPGAIVADRQTTRSSVTSATGLAASNLAGLGRLTLGFGFLLAVISSVLALLVGSAQRRRTLVVLAILGATPRQRAGFLSSEARALVTAGLVGGLVAGGVIAAELVKVLNGIFDPAPEHPAIPVVLLAALVAVVLIGTAGTTWVAGRLLGRFDATRLRDL